MPSPKYYGLKIRFTRSHVSEIEGPNEANNDFVVYSSRIPIICMFGRTRITRDLEEEAAKQGRRSRKKDRETGRFIRGRLRPVTQLKPNHNLITQCNNTVGAIIYM